MWLQPSFSSTMALHLWQRCQPSCFACSRNLFVSSSFGQSGDWCHLQLHWQHTFVLQRLHLPYFRPSSRYICSGLIHSPHFRDGQYILFLVENSANFLFQVFLKPLSNSRSTCFRGMWSVVQHLGGMFCGSVRDNLKLRLRQEWHMRWPHLSLADFEDGTSSSMQTTHSTLSLVSKEVYVVAKLGKRGSSQLDRLLRWSLKCWTKETPKKRRRSPCRGAHTARRGHV